MTKITDAGDELISRALENLSVSECEVCGEPTYHGDVENEVVCSNCDTSKTTKHATGTIDGYGFSLRVDGDALAGLVADIESALAEVKQERESE